MQQKRPNRKLKYNGLISSKSESISLIINSERKAETKFTELNDAMREYHEVFGHELPPLHREAVLSNFYTPTDEELYREFGFIALSMIGIGGVLYYFES